MEVSAEKIAEPELISWFEMNRKWIAGELRILAEEVEEGDIWTATEFFLLLKEREEKFKLDYDVTKNLRNLGKGNTHKIQKHIDKKLRKRQKEHKSFKKRKNSEKKNL